ncbi:predicted protein [Naegleria gruberi]|uniref:Predicted protein n=1 Tax=Naegleria gruberi TaxID=5762 RepID=D2VBM8_NAEGR|nr:uncharacterized protein NAEGRDRAFT_48240 [Naegleria gruberi]EFC45823.1 predicted protein [Naegleria gruberi]|eukprot:XP_002678567.1 predicted protein [Naegleria gruberi strain NEG-M]
MGITQNKLLTVVKSISLEHLESGLNAEEAESLWKEADLNHDGILSESEAKSLLKNLNLTIMERLRKAMSDLDQYLQSDELLKEWMKECDENQDGKITKDEFLKMVMSGHAVDTIPKILLDSIHGIEEQSEKKRKRQVEDQAKEDSDKEEEEEEKEEEETFESELKKVKFTTLV